MSAPPSDPRALCAEAKEHLSSGRIAEAEQAARQAIAADPQMPQAHVLLGMALTRSGSTSVGIDHLRKAVELDPASRTAKANLAVALERGGQEREALPLWRELAEEDPSDTRATEAAKRLETRLGGPSPEAEPQTEGWNPLQDSGPTPPPPPPPPQQGWQGQAPVPPPAQPGQPPPPGTMPPPVAGPEAYGGGPVGEDPGGWTLENIKMIITAPAEFFAMQRGHTDLGKPIAFLAINAAITVVLQTLGQILAMPIGGGAPSGTAMPAMLAGMACGSIVVVPIAIAFTFAIAGVLHLFVMMFGGTGGYVATFRTVVYTSVPSMLVALPAGICSSMGGLVATMGSVLQLAVGLWALVLTVTAFMALHDLGMARAIGAALLPYVICVGLIIFTFVAVLGAAFGSGAFGSGGIPGLPFPSGGPGPSPGGP
jgi:hypothetical protein